MGGANNTSVHQRTYARKQPQPRISATIHTQVLHMRAHRHSRRSSLWHLRAKQPLHSLKRASQRRQTRSRSRSRRGARSKNPGIGGSNRTQTTVPRPGTLSWGCATEP